MMDMETENDIGMEKTIGIGNLRSEQHRHRQVSALGVIEWLRI